MTQTLSLIRQTLIALIDGRAGPATALGGTDWQRLADLAREHRLEPLLHSHAPALQGVVPAPIRVEWASASRQSAIRALRVQSTLMQIDAALGARAIGFMALKGAWLAWHGYAQPALRPMRDIDILVEPGKVMAAYRALCAAGFDAKPHGASPDAALDRDKHLPPLGHRQTGILLEIHSRLSPAQTDADDLRRFDVPARLFAQAIPQTTGGRDILYPAPTDTLLHLISHAAISHKFNNGALVLPDIEATLRHDIDWSRFWAMARTEGWERDCVLLLALVRRDRKAAPGFPPVPPVPDSVLDATAELLLAVSRQDRGVYSIALAGSDHRAGPVRWYHFAFALLRRTVPTRSALSEFAKVPDHQRFLWRYYPGWALKNARKLWASRDEQVRDDVGRHRLLNNWACPPIPNKAQTGES